MSKSAFTPHVTVAAVAESEGRFLVVREHVNGTTCLNNPAGHVEDGESPVEAVIRETLEETGYRFVPEALGGVYVWRHPDGETFVRFDFIGHCSNHDPKRALDTGIIGPEWLTLEELNEQNARLRSPLVMRSFKEYQAGIRYPLEAITSLVEP